MIAEPCVFRRARGDAGDLDELMDAMTDAFDPAFGEAWTRAQCVGILPLPGVWLTLARNGPASCGFALARVVADEAELLLLAVRPAHRRTGIGAGLLEDTARYAIERGATRLFLEMREGNPAHGLYRRHGFAEIGRRRDYYRGADGGRHDAVTLARGLSPTP